MDRKLIFDAVRRVLGRGFRRPEVAALDEAIDQAQRTTSSPSATAPSRRIGPRGLVLIKRFEGCRLRAYPDPATGGGAVDDRLGNDVDRRQAGTAGPDDHPG